MTNTKQIGCEAEDARFVTCLTCLFQNDPNGCEQVRDEGNMKYIIK